MRLSEISNKNITRIKFISFFGAAVFLCLVIFSSFWAPSELKAGTEIAKAPVMEYSQGTEQLLHVSELLQLKWQQLEEQYDRHALSLADRTAGSLTIGMSSKKLMEAEVSYAKVLDSVSVENAGSLLVVQVDSIVNSFRSMLQNKQVVITRLAGIASKKPVEPGSVHWIDSSIQQEKISQLEKDVQAKAILITQLQTQLNSAPARKSNSIEVQQELRKMEKDLQSKTAMISKMQLQLNALPAKASREGTISPASLKKMKDEIEFLKWALRSEVSSNQALTKTVNKLKQANASLANQLKQN